MSYAVTLTEYTDPVSAWAWGSEPKLRRLVWCHGGRIRWRRVMACLREGHAASRPGAADQDFDSWNHVARHTSMPFVEGTTGSPNSSLLACRAVKTAELQGVEVGTRVLRRLREALFLHGQPIDQEESIRAALQGLPGLRMDTFCDDLQGELSRVRLHADRRETRLPNAFVRTLVEIGEGEGAARACKDGWRYSIPTIVVQGRGGEMTVPGWKPYEAYEEAVLHVAGEALRPAADPSPNQALEFFGSLTGAELEMLCGSDAQPPQDAIRLDGDQPVFFTLAEARVRNLLGRGASA